MANRFFNPNEQFCDGTGLPYAGGSLAFYASGTSTPLNTYSNSTLTIANANPVVLDSAGRANNVFLQNLPYKVVLSDANSNVIWTADPVYASDYSTVAAFQSGNGSPNGSVAGTAGTTTIAASAYWDATNNILYVCTQTGTTSTAVWTAVNAASAAAVVVPPQGYLTLTSGTPILTGDTTSATVYYTPLVGTTIPIYNGTTFVPTTFSELSLSLVAQHAASTLYDIFVFNNSGVLTLVTGPAWSNSGAGTGARGTGAGTTQLSRVSGLWVNTVSMTGRNGATTYSIPANQATYVGSLFIDSTPGQTSCLSAYGQSRKWGLWNTYNRKPIIMQAGDGTANWTYNSTTIRPSNNNSANSLTTFCGLPEERITVDYFQEVQGGTTSTTNQIISQWTGGIGWNSTTAISSSAFRGTPGFRIDGSTIDFLLQEVQTSRYINVPGIGINTATSLEAILTANGSPSVTWSGTAAGLLLTANYLG